MNIDELEERMRKAGETLDKKITETSADYIKKVMRDSAVRTAPVDTGNLRELLTSEEGKVEHTDEGIEISISSPAPYSIFLEYGTGNLGDPDVPHTSKTSWKYKTTINGNEVWMTGKPIAPQRYMRPALHENIPNISRILAGVASEVFHHD